MKKWLNEPLVHFLCIGALMFALYSLLNKDEISIDEKKIIVSYGDVERLGANWLKKWNRPPTEKELQGLIDSYIREEVYYREALALGLDQDDTVLRRRLMQKMEFLSNDLAELSTPDETTLNEYFLKHQDKYELPAKLSFSQIYFSLDKRGAKAMQDAKNVLADIQAAPSPVLRAPDKGDPFMMQYDFTLETPFEVARTFGKNFAEQIFQSNTKGWQGPIESGYGLHVVRIDEKIDARMPELASVMEQVRTDWMFVQRQKVNKELYERFKARYEIVVEMPKQSGMAETIALGRTSS